LCAPVLSEGGLFEARWRRDDDSRVAGRNFTWHLPIEITADDEEWHVDIVDLTGVAPGGSSAWTALRTGESCRHVTSFSNGAGALGSSRPRRDAI